MADAKAWPALVIRTARALAPEEEEALLAHLDDFGPTAVQDLTELPLPPGGLWDPTFPPPPDPPPAPVHPMHRANAARDRKRTSGYALGTQGRATLRAIRGRRQGELPLSE